jgi:malate dehydrogenase
VSIVAILGAGPVGAATAARLAERAHVREVRLVDASVAVAAGKTLDIRQAGPVLGFDTVVSAEADILSAAGATVIVLADSIEGGEWTGDRGRMVLEQIVRAGSQAPIVFAGPEQAPLMEAAYRDLRIPAHRLVASAPAALVSAVRALAGMEMNVASVDVTVVGRPPTFVIGWSAAAAGGSLVTDRVAAHRLLAISASMKKLWPSGPHAIGSATAEIVEALIQGRRRAISALTILDGELGARGAAVLLPLDLGRLRVLGHTLPSLSPQERTEFANAIGT